MTNVKNVHFVNNVGGYSGPLYKYIGTIDHAVNSIENRNIYLAAPSSFNDPFDCAVKFNKDNIVEMNGLNHNWFLYFKKILSPYQIEQIKQFDNDPYYSSMDEFIKSIVNLLDNTTEAISYDELLSKFCTMTNIHNTLPQARNIKVSCFSKTNGSIPMWAYYANSHKGVCLEYDLTQLQTDNFYENNLKKSIQEVVYTDQFNLSNIHKPSLSFQKSNQWSHEQECRIICETNEEFIGFPCLKAIYVGVNASSDTRSTFIDLADKYDLEIYLGKVNTEAFQVEFIDFKKYRYNHQIKLFTKRFNLSL